MPNMTEPKELLIHELADLLYAERRFPRNQHATAPAHASA